MSEEIPNESELLRKALLIPCDSKEDLRDWILLYLGLDFPDAIVDPESTTSPLDAIWELYHAMRLGNNEDMQRIMWYAARDSYKTLGAAVIEILAILHLRRSVGHMAAVESQAKNSQKYVKQAFARPYLRDYLVSDNVEKVEVRWYENRNTGDTITERQFKELTGPEADQFLAHEYSIQIVICTMRGANSLHVPLLVVDEVDIAPPGPYEEAKGIPTEFNGMLPITLLISTRKSVLGLVQREIDEADKTKLQIRHWNILEITKRCEPERHRPEEPLQDIYVSDDLLRHISPAEYELLSLDQKDLYRKKQGFAGCLKCPIFFACQGNLATRQTSNAALLKSIEYTIGKFRAAQTGYANAQLLCRKPDTKGLIYPHYDPEVHMITAAQMAEMITGDEHPPTFTKADLIALMKTKEGKFSTGMDHGFGHNFAMVSLFKHGIRAFIFDVQAAPELELEDKIALCQQVLPQWNPDDVWPDTSDPGSNKTLYKKGFKLRLKWDKGKGSVKRGIDIVRSKFRPLVGPPTLYLLRGDPGCELLSSRLGKYAWKVDAAGRLTDEPVDKDDDECDAMRYTVMNEFEQRGQVTVASDTPANVSSSLRAPEQPMAQPTTTNYLKTFIQQATGEVPGPAEDSSVVIGSGSSRGKKGRFVWDI